MTPTHDPAGQQPAAGRPRDFEEQLASLDPVTVTLSRALRRLDAILERRGWDQTPSLWVARERGGSGVGEVPVKVVWEQVETGDMLSAQAPGDALAELAKYPGRVLPPSPGVIGIAYSCEAWIVGDPSGRSGELSAGALRQAANRELHRNESRIELRSLSCVTFSGAMLAHMMARDPLQMDRLETAAVPGVPGPPVAMDGFVADSLRFLLERAQAGK